MGNWAGGNTGTGIYWEVSKDATISSNLLVGNGTGVKTSGSQNVAITHNTFYNNTNQLRIGADYRPGTISFHTTAAAHMANIDVQANLFAEPATATSGDRFVVDPENFNTPLPSIRLDQYNRNTYALTSNSTTTGPVRFRTDTDSPRRTPDEFVAVAGGLPHQVWTATNPATVFTNQAAGDYRIASAGNPIYPWDPGVNMPAAAQAQLQGPLPARAGAVFHTGP